jgi:hypothetical protein
VEAESDSAIPFLEVRVIRKGTTLTTRIYRKTIQRGRYLNLKSIQPLRVKKRFNPELPPHAKIDKICLMKLAA